MKNLDRQDRAAFSGFAATLHEMVSLNLHENDGMFHGNGRHYLTCGGSALNVIAAAVGLAGIEPKKILDFGAGAGRVTRWLRAAYASAEISATDTRAEDLEFCAREFGARTWLSGTDVDGLDAPSRYDLIWVGSVLTHLPANISERLVRKLLSWLRPDGLLIVSLHGRFVHFRGPQFNYYGVASGWEDIERQYLAEGYGYADYPGQDAYGISLSKPSWASSLAERLEGTRLVLMSERAWDNHHDILALQNRPVTAPLSVRTSQAS